MKKNKHSLVYIVQLIKYEEKKNGGKKFVVVKETRNSKEIGIKKFYVRSWHEALHYYDRIKKEK